MADEITGAGPTAPNEVDEPIINSPFAEPALHWQIEKGQPPVKVPGRRPASYYYRVPESAARGRKAKAQRSLLGETSIGEREDLDLVNWLRRRIKDWRKAGWPGTSPGTRELLRLWWAGSDQRLHPLRLQDGHRHRQVHRDGHAGGLVHPEPGRRAYQRALLGHRPDRLARTSPSATA